MKTSAPVSSTGSPVTSAQQQFCLLFESLAEAESYCREAVREVPCLQCEVFDSAGRTNPPVAVFVDEKFEQKLDSEAHATRLIRWGMVAVGTSLPLFLYA